MKHAKDLLIGNLKSIKESPTRGGKIANVEDKSPKMGKYLQKKEEKLAKTTYSAIIESQKS